MEKSSSCFSSVSLQETPLQSAPRPGRNRWQLVSAGPIGYIFYRTHAHQGGAAMEDQQNGALSTKAVLKRMWIVSSTCSNANPRTTPYGLECSGYSSSLAPIRKSPTPCRNCRPLLRDGLTMGLALTAKNIRWVLTTERPTHTLSLGIGWPSAFFERTEH